MRKPFEIVAKGQDTADIYIYGDIGESWFGESVTAKQFVKDLDGVKAQNLNIRINSFGGSVVDGLAIFNAIKRKAGTKTVVIDGLAASIASLIAMAGDTVEIASNAMFMIHAPWGGVRGNANTLRDYADVLDKFAGAMTSAYSDKTGKKDEEILALLTDGKDHWYSAQEAKDFGLADSIGKAVEVAASFNLSRFDMVPASLANLTARKENMLTDAEIKAAADAAAAKALADAAQAKADADLREAARKVDINTLFAHYERFDGAFALRDELIRDGKVDIQAAREKLLTFLAKDSEPLGGSQFRTVRDEGDKMRAGFMAALEHRAGLKADDTANQYRSYSLLDMARDFLRASGGSLSGSKMEIAAAAFTHSTSDFPKILENIANKSMLKGWEENDENFEKFTSSGSLSDFKIAKRLDLGLFPNLQSVPEGGEYSYGTVSERGEQVVLGTYGRMFSITRQAIINDDMGAFTTIPNRMGRAAKRTVANLAYSALLDNQVMSDGVVLFHTASHFNLAGTPSAISTDSVQAMRVAMALQKDPDNTASAGLNIRMKYLLAPVALEGRAAVVRASEFHYGATINNTIPNAVRNTFELITDPRLDASSATAWYGLADPATYDGIQVNYLDGNKTPYMEQQNGWNVDGVSYKVRIDASAKALDYRVFQKNAGV